MHAAARPELIQLRCSDACLGLVILPWRCVPPQICSDGTGPENAMSWRGLAKRVMPPSSATGVAAATKTTPRSACSACTPDARDHSGSDCFDMCLQSIQPGRPRHPGRVLSSTIRCGRAARRRPGLDVIVPRSHGGPA